jgi:sec-independent protein translocase protein TatA
MFHGAFAQVVEPIEANSDKVSREKLEAIANKLGIDYTNKDDEELRRAIDIEINKSR